MNAPNLSSATRSSSSPSLRGVYTALVTPFNNDDRKSIDFESLDALVEFQLASGVSGIVSCGTTGESPTLSDDEHLAVLERVIKRAGKDLTVLAGTGSASTEHAMQRSRAAEKLGAAGILVVVPYYNRPTQDGLVAHFIQVARAVSCPVIVYNIPSRTGSDLGIDALARICDEASNVIAIKEAGGNVIRAQELGVRFGDRLTVLSGDDALTLPMISVGGKGVISVASNVLPVDVSRATNLALAGQMNEAWRLHRHLIPFYNAMFLESNPAPVKAALAHRGLVKDVLRGPLIPVAASTRASIARTLQTHTPSETR